MRNYRFLCLCLFAPDDIYEGYYKRFFSSPRLSCDEAMHFLLSLFILVACIYWLSTRPNSERGKCCFYSSALLS